MGTVLKWSKTMDALVQVAPSSGYVLRTHSRAETVINRWMLRTASGRIHGGIHLYINQQCQHELPKQSQD